MNKLLPRNVPFLGGSNLRMLPSFLGSASLPSLSTLPSARTGLLIDVFLTAFWWTLVYSSGGEACTLLLKGDVRGR